MEVGATASVQQKRRSANNEDLQRLLLPVLITGTTIPAVGAAVSGTLSLATSVAGAALGGTLRGGLRLISPLFSSSLDDISGGLQEATAALGRTQFTQTYGLSPTVRLLRKGASRRVAARQPQTEPKMSEPALAASIATKPATQQPQHVVQRQTARLHSIRQQQQKLQQRLAAGKATSQFRLQPAFLTQRALVVKQQPNPAAAAAAALAQKAEMQAHWVSNNMGLQASLL